jgi:hypothetical protein
MRRRRSGAGRRVRSGLLGCEGLPRGRDTHTIRPLEDPVRFTRTATGGGLTPRWARMRRSGGPLSRRTNAPSSRFRILAVCTTTTNVVPPDDHVSAWHAPAEERSTVRSFLTGACTPGGFAAGETAAGLPAEVARGATMEPSARVTNAADPTRILALERMVIQPPCFSLPLVDTRQTHMRTQDARRNYASEARCPARP